MNKKLLSLLLMVCAATTFASCDDTTTSNSEKPSNVVESSSEEQESSSTKESSTVEESSSSTTDSSGDSSTTTPEVNDDEYNKLPNWEETKQDISTGQDLLDAEFGRPYMTGAEYVIYFTLGTSLPNDPEKQVVESSNEKVFTIEKVAGGYKLTAKHAGKAYLRIKDSNGFVRYCKLIYVEDPIDLDYMEEYLVYDCEYWVSYGWSDTYVLTFYEGGKYSLSGTITGQSFGTINGTYEYVETIHDGKEYSYVFTDTNIANVGLVGFHVATTGGYIYLQAEGWTDAILTPSKTGEQEEMPE